MTAEEIIEEIDNGFGGDMKGLKEWMGELSNNPEKFHSISNIEETLKEVTQNYHIEEENDMPNDPEEEGHMDK